MSSCVCVYACKPASVSLFFKWPAIPACVCACVWNRFPCVRVSVHVRLVICRCVIYTVLVGMGKGGGNTGRQRDALLRSHYVRQGCGNAVLGNIHVTCVPGRWLATHQWYVPVSSTRHPCGATPTSFQHHGAHLGQSNSYCSVEVNVLHKSKQYFLRYCQPNQAKLGTHCSLLYLFNFCIKHLCKP